MIDLVFYSVVEVLTGLAPSYATFLVLRALFGIGMGAEWGVGASLVMEKVPPRYRGVVSGLRSRGTRWGYSPGGAVLTCSCSPTGDGGHCSSSAAPALLALYVRRASRNPRLARDPSRKLERSGPRDRRQLEAVFCTSPSLMAMMNMVSHGTQDMYLAFLERGLGFGPTGRAALTAFSQVGALVGGVLCGLYSDRLGRRRTSRSPWPARC